MLQVFFKKDANLPFPARFEEILGFTALMQRRFETERRSYARRFQFLQ
jgi:hypothetical protein